MKKIFALVLVLGTLSAFAQKDFNILKYGAQTGLNQINTLSIQKAIDAAHAAGGGKVIIPKGSFVTGPLILKSNVELHLADEAILLGSAKRLDYNENNMAVLSAEGQHHISITGKGMIHGQGRDLVEDLLLLISEGKIKDNQWPLKGPQEKNRPNLIFFLKCKAIRINNITLRNAASWVQNYKECENVVIDSIKVHSNEYWNNDGIDIVDSKNVKITNSYFNAADDAICLKSENPNSSCEHIWIENCVLRSSASGLKLGTGSLGGFKDITVKNINVFNTYRSAIALETVDGAYLEDVNISNVTGKNVGNAIFIRLGHRNTDANKYSTLNKVSIRNVKVEIPATKADRGYPSEGPLPRVPPHNIVPASITGLVGHPVENVTLDSIEIVYPGGADKEIAFIDTDALGKVTENASGYPEFNMFGELPSWGLYVRHAKGIKISNFKLSLKKYDFRPALIFDDVDNLTLNNLYLPIAKESPMIIYRNVANKSISGFDLPSIEKR